MFFIVRTVNFYRPLTNKGQSTLTKGDIDRRMMLYAKKILSISSIIFTSGSTRREGGPVSSRCTWNPILGEEEVVRGSAMIPFETAMVVF